MSIRGRAQRVSANEHMKWRIYHPAMEFELCQADEFILHRQRSHSW